MITNIITQVAGQQQPSSVIQIIKCDESGCSNAAQFDIQNEKDKALAENTCLRTYRTVQTGDGRTFGYCGDACEVRATATGKHNIPEPSKIISQASPVAIAAAAQAVAVQKQSEEALRTGSGGKIQITE